MILDRLANAANSRGIRRGLDAALEFLTRTALDALPLGKRDIDGDRLYALVQEYDATDPTTRKFESHRKYIDVQLVCRGLEIIYWTPASRLRRAGAYSAESDAVLYDDRVVDTPVTPLGLEAGSFAIFFPEDAHVPGCRWTGMSGSEAKVRKIVVKVRVEST